MTDETEVLLTMPLRIGDNLLPNVSEFSDSLVTVYLGLCQHAYGDFAPPGEAAKSRAITDLRALNLALSAFGAANPQKSPSVLMAMMFTPGAEWGKFRCIEVPVLEGYPNGPTSPVVVSDLMPDTTLWPSWSLGLFGLCCLQQLVETADPRLVALAAEAVTLAYAANVQNLAAQSRMDSAEMVVGAFREKEDKNREKGNLAQTERKKRVVEYARRLAEAKRSTFRNRTHAAAHIQADVRAFAKQEGHNLGTRLQTITDMLAGITFGKSNTP